MSQEKQILHLLKTPRNPLASKKNMECIAGTKDIHKIARYQDLTNLLASSLENWEVRGL